MPDFVNDVWDDLRRAAEDAWRNLDVDIRLSGDGTSSANVSLHRERMWITLAVVGVLAFFVGRALSK